PTDVLYTLSLHDALPIFAKKEEVFVAFATLPEEWKNIDVLINNAGNAHGLARFQDADLADLEAMIDINIKGVIYVTKACLPFFRSEEHTSELQSRENLVC